MALPRGAPRTSPNTYGNYFEGDVAPNGLLLVRKTQREHDELFSEDNGPSRGIRGKMVYFCEQVNKVNRHWNYNRRLLVIAQDHTGAARILLYPKGGILSRTVRDRAKDRPPKEGELVTVKYSSHGNDATNLAFLVERKRTKHGEATVPQTGPPDWCIKCNDVKQRDRIMQILKTLGVTVEPLNEDLSERFTEAATLKTKERNSASTSNVRLLEQQVVARQVLDQHREAMEQRREQEALASQPKQVDPRLKRIFSEVEQQLAQNLKEYKEGEILKARGDIQAYQAMLEERNREIEALKGSYLSLTENPEFWRSCPNCKEAAYSHAINLSAPDALQRQALERKLHDYQELIDHLQMTRAGASGVDRLTETSELAQLEKETEVLDKKVNQLQRLIIENPYPTEDVRIRAEQIASDKVDEDVTDTDKAHDLHTTVAELQRESATRDRELRHAKNVLREAFRRQVEELSGVRTQFQLYDEYIVDYLEKVFSGNAFPQGSQSHGQTPRQIAQATSQAARQAATPGAFPHHTSTANMPPHHEAMQSPFSNRQTSRAATSPISTFVPPNVISNPLDEDLPPVIPSRDPLGVEFPPQTFTAVGRGKRQPSIL
eukprot:TRINITY_DN27894_c0_g1_i1.p1 TRINITY_DN27894_c0_g1~~TRINITY_DN27894_c0_g1_i1.p1  ORF type:complete len:623 (+),score=201.44 TRINITY_DN27894_c0_g1_i1:59-1870(+)